MGYRHSMMSSYIDRDVNEYAKNFFNKYKDFVHFSDYWTSVDEAKMYAVWKPFIEDCHKNFKLLELDVPLQLVFFADEGLIQLGRRDIIHVLIDGVNDPIETEMVEPFEGMSYESPH